MSFPRSHNIQMIWILCLHCLCLDWITKRLISDVQVTAVCPSGCWTMILRPSRQFRHSSWGVKCIRTPWKVNELAESGHDTRVLPVLLDGVNQSKYLLILFQNNAELYFVFLFFCVLRSFIFFSSYFRYNSATCQLVAMWLFLWDYPTQY